MQLEKIITLANQNSRLRFLAMERSLRACGCNLPLWVIPYDDNKFALPAKAEWWEIEDVSQWLKKNNARKVMRKYQCLLESNYQFIDSDVIFLRNPETVLKPFSGFITSCGHWHNPNHTATKEVLQYFNKTTTTWQQKVFNSGQFACDEILYDFDSLKKIAEQTEYKNTCLDFKFHEQPGLNLFVNLSGVSISNLTLQPYFMESTWAGDYTDANFERFWKDESRKPYIIHWAGCNMNTNRPIDKLFLDYLTAKERIEWDKYLSVKVAKQNEFGNSVKKQLRKIKLAVKTLRE